MPKHIVLHLSQNGSGEILWSWHIWSTKDIQTIDCYNGDRIMDRNLGAKKVTSDDIEDIRGLFYQWGRKDPIQKNTSNMVESSSSTGSIQFSIKNPTTMITGFDSTSKNDYRRGSWLWGSTLNNNLWGNSSNSSTCSKTIYDPCPVGYKLPSLSTWEGVTRTSNDTNGCSFKFNTKGDVGYFTYGYLDYNGTWADYDQNYCSPSGRHQTACCYGGDNSLIGTVAFLSSVFYNVNNGDFRSTAINTRCIVSVHYYAQLIFSQLSSVYFQLFVIFPTMPRSSMAAGVSGPPPGVTI